MIPNEFGRGDALPPLPRWLQDGRQQVKHIYLYIKMASYKIRKYPSLPDIQITRLPFYTSLNTAKMHQNVSLYPMIQELNEHFSK